MWLMLSGDICMLYTLEDVERFSWVGSVRYTDPARPLISGCLESTRPVVCLDRDLSEDCVDRFFLNKHVNCRRRHRPVLRINFDVGDATQRVHQPLVFRFCVLVPGPARPITFSEDGARPGPAHHIFNKSRPGPAHHMAKRPMKHELYMGRPDNFVGRPVCCPVLKGAGAYADVLH